MSSVGGKIILTQKPKIYHDNGIKVDWSDYPSNNAIAYFINNIVHDCFIRNNPPVTHKCNRLCHQPLQIMLGYPRNETVFESCGPDSRDMVMQFEKLLTVFLREENEDEVILRSMALQFLPCSKVTEILSVNIYLWSYFRHQIVTWCVILSFYYS